MRRVRGLRHIKTMSDVMRGRNPNSIGTRSSVPRSFTPPGTGQTQQSFNISSFTPPGIRGGMGRARQTQQTRQPFKARSFLPSRLSSMCVQKLCKPIFKLLQEDGYVSVLVQLPQVAVESAQLDVRGDILVVQAEVKIAGSKIQYYTECLLPFEAQLSSIDRSYREGILRVNLKAKEKS